MPLLGNLVGGLHFVLAERALVEGDPQTRGFWHADVPAGDVEWLGEQVIGEVIEAVDRGPLRKRQDGPEVGAECGGEARANHLQKEGFLEGGGEAALAQDAREPSSHDKAVADLLARRTREGHGSEVFAVAISRDGKWLASSSADGTARIWDTSTWKQVEVLKHGTNVFGVAFTPDGSRLACACANNLIRLWDMKTFKLVGELDGHQDYVHQIAFSPDGTRLVSGSGDKTVRIWDSLSVPERAKRATR